MTIKSDLLKIKCRGAVNWSIMGQKYATCDIGIVSAHVVGGGIKGGQKVL